MRAALYGAPPSNPHSGSESESVSERETEARMVKQVTCPRSRRVRTVPALEFGSSGPEALRDAWRGPPTSQYKQTSDTFGFGSGLF